MSLLSILGLIEKQVISLKSEYNVKIEVVKKTDKLGEPIIFVLFCHDSVDSTQEPIIKRIAEYYEEYFTSGLSNVIWIETDDTIAENYLQILDLTYIYKE